MSAARRFKRGNKVRTRAFAVCCLLGLTAAASPAMGQGSIFGLVTNSDATTPADSDISFFGYLDDTDEEIRIESSTGAGYDSGHWYDDFQNYLTEAPDNPYDYHFYNTVNGEGFILSKLIPNNSFQEENIPLGSVTWPQAPSGVSGQAVSFSSVVVTWSADTLLTYHVYRRSATSNGSLFRIDDPGGLLSNPGVPDSFFVDNTVDRSGSYQYLLIAEDAAGNLSPHSSIVTINSTAVVAPTVTGISPSSGVVLGGTAVTIFGTGFDMAGATATIGGNPVASIAVVSPFEITGYTPAGVIGPANVIVTNAASGLSSAPLAGGFTYFDNSAPTVAGIPDQTIAEGEAFQDFDLDLYVSDPDHSGADISWTYSGNTDLLVSIDGNRIATVSPPDSNWFGSEAIIFRGTDPGDLFDEDTAVFTVTPVNDAPIVLGIPNQIMIGDGPAVPINLDNHVLDVDNIPAEMTWSYGGASNLGVDITGGVATVTVPDPGWVGTDTIIFRATDPDLAFDEDSAIFIHVAVDMPQSDFESVLVGHADSLEFSIRTPDGFTLIEPGFGISGSDVVIRRGDGGNIDDDIPPNSDVLFRVVWTPADTLADPGTIDITSVSVDNSDQLILDGRAVAIDMAAPFADYDFGDVNAVDIRAAETLSVDADVLGNTGATVLGTALAGSSGDFTALAPSAGDTLIPGSVVTCLVLAHPSATGIRTAEFWIQYGADLTGGTFTDSLKLLNLTATGAEPGCVVVESVVDFGERRIGETHSKTVTIENSSTVIEIIDSLYFLAFQNIFAIDPSVSRPLILPPGDTAISVMFSPQANQFYSATLNIADSAAGDCNPPLIRGIGVNEYVHWEADPSSYLGLVKLCDTLSISDFRIANRSGEFNLVFDGLDIDSAEWFTIEPDPATLIGTVLTPSDSIVFNRIGYHPRGLMNPVPYALTVNYHVDTMGAASENFVTVPVSAAGGCVGQAQLTGSLIFGSIDIGGVSRDTAILTNTGSCRLVIDSIVTTGAEFTLLGFTAPAVINAGQSVNLVVRFSPSDIGDRQGSIVLHHDGYVAGFDPDSDCPLTNQDEIVCSGVGIDTSPPTISSITASSCGQIVTMQIFDIGSGIDSVFAFWREGNAIGDFRSSTNSPVFVGGDQWRLQLSSADMDNDSINIYGYELRIIARDREGRADTLTTSISGCLPPLDGGVFISGAGWLGDDGQDTLWHLVSFPGDLPSYRVDSIFFDLSGMTPSNDDTDDLWRLYEYRSGAFRALTTDIPSNRIAPGQGYWFRHINALDTLRLAEIGTAFTWPTFTRFDIPLEFGWNLIGNPYLFPVHLDETNLDSAVVSSFVRQIQPALPGGRNWWELTDIGGSLPPLQPWQGYAIYCEQPGGYMLSLDPHFSPEPDSADSHQSWKADIFLHGAGNIIGTVAIGTRPRASDGPDISDVRPIALLSRPPELFLIHPEHGNFIRDIRPERDLVTWIPEIGIDQIAAEPVRLSWIMDDPSDPAKRLVLRDKVAGVTVDMRIQHEYTIDNPRQAPSGRFAIYYGDREAVDAALQGETSPRPNSFRLYQNFPNPFNPTTTIAFDIPSPGFVSLEIFDVTGRRVSEVAAGYYQTGSYRVEWNGRDSRGNMVASGIYFYRLKANGLTETKKLLLLK